MSEPIMTRPEFTVHRLNDHGLDLAGQLAEIFSRTLDDVEKLVPAGRDRALVVTKLQEACFFAKRGIAIDPTNQQKFERTGTAETTHA